MMQEVSTRVVYDNRFMRPVHTANTLDRLDQILGGMRNGGILRLSFFLGLAPESPLFIKGKSTSYATVAVGYMNDSQRYGVSFNIRSRTYYVDENGRKTLSPSGSIHRVLLNDEQDTDTHKDSESPASPVPANKGVSRDKAVSVIRYICEHRVLPPNANWETTYKES